MHHLTITTFNRACTQDVSGKSMLIRAADYKTLESTKVALGVLGFLSVGVAVGAYKLYSLHNMRAKKIDFAAFACKALNAQSEGDIEGDPGSQKLFLDFKGSTITVSEVNGHVQLGLDDAVLELDQYQTLTDFLAALSKDVQDFPELYAEYDTVFANKLGMVVLKKYPPSFMPRELNSDDIIFPENCRQVYERGAKLLVLECINTGEKFFCKPMVQYGVIPQIASHVSNIDPHAPKFGLRSFFTFRCSQLLGFDVVPETKFFKYDGTWYYGLKEAQGQTGANYASSMDVEQLFSDPVIVKRSIELQIIDALTGQGDRHGANYRINPERREVKSIDNDICGGSYIEHPHSTVDRDRALRGVWLPPVLDTDIIARINNISEDDFLALMDDCRFTQAEANAGLARLAALKKHVIVLEARQNVFETGVVAGLVQSDARHPAQSPAVRDNDLIELDDSVVEAMEMTPLLEHAERKPVDWETVKKQSLEGVGIAVIEPDQWNRPEVIARFITPNLSRPNLVRSHTSYLYRDHFAYTPDPRAMNNNSLDLVF